MRNQVFVDSFVGEVTLHLSFPHGHGDGEQLDGSKMKKSTKVTSPGYEGGKTRSPSLVSLERFCFRHYAYTPRGVVL